MRPRTRSSHAVRQLCVLLLASSLGLLASASLARAQRFPMTLELETGQVAEFGSVMVERDPEGGLVFDVEVDPAVVGQHGSLHHVYFNLAPELRRLRVETLDPDIRPPHRIHRSWRRLARSGARFDWKVDLTGPRGRHGRRMGLHEARFRVSAAEPLEVEDLLPISMTKQGDAVQMAIKLRKARTADGRVQYVGGRYEPPVAEPPADEPPADEPPVEESGSSDPPSTDLPDSGALPPAPDGCSWVVDLFGGGDPVLVCG